MSGSLLLISSYPKSGNTWARLVFDYLIRGGKDEVSINELSGAVHGRARRQLFDTYSPACSSDLSFDEIENLLPELFRSLVMESKGLQVVKVHECSHRNRRGEWLFPPECVQAAVYLVRHPFDVAVSFANHMGQTLEEIVETLGRKGSNSPRHPGNLDLPLPQWMGSWSENVESWLLRSPYRTAVARYEDLHERPVETFGRLAAEAGVEAEPGKVEAAVAATRFDILQAQEREKGFRERPDTSPVFFRAGRPKSWEGLLTDEMRARICRDHGPMMAQLGYREDGSVAAFQNSVGAGESRQAR